VAILTVHSVETAASVCDLLAVTDSDITQTFVIMMDFFMDIIAHGIDLVDCPRIEEMIERHGSHFLDRVFTQAEQNYATTAKNRIEKLAGRFAAKEAVLKMLGTGWRGKISWTDIEVLGNSLGRPIVTLSGEVERIAGELGIGEVSLSISHTANFVMASAVAIAKTNGNE